MDLHYLQAGAPKVKVRKRPDGPNTSRLICRAYHCGHRGTVFEDCHGAAAAGGQVEAVVPGLHLFNCQNLEALLSPAIR